jgi:hypothetical protein
MESKLNIHNKILKWIFYILQIIIIINCCMHFSQNPQIKAVTFKFHRCTHVPLENKTKFSEFWFLSTISFNHHLPMWPWSYGSCIYLCNPCLSPQKLYVRTPFMARCIRYIIWCSLPVTFDSSVVLSGYSDYHHPWY